MMMTQFPFLIVAFRFYLYHIPHFKYIQILSFGSFWSFNNSYDFNGRNFLINLTTVVVLCDDLLPSILLVVNGRVIEPDVEVWAIDFLITKLDEKLIFCLAVFNQAKAKCKSGNLIN